MNAPLQKSRLGRGLASLIGDAPVTQPRQHGQQRWPVGRAGALAAVDVLLDNLGAEPFGGAPTGLALSGDRVTLAGVVGVGLRAGRDIDGIP